AFGKKGGETGRKLTMKRFVALSNRDGGNPNLGLKREPTGYSGPRKRAARGYQSLPSRSPEFGVRAAHHVCQERAELTNRTLPSPMPALMPPVCGEFARSPKPQPPTPGLSGRLMQFCKGRVMNIAAGPVDSPPSTEAIAGPQSGQ